MGELPPDRGPAGGRYVVAVDQRLPEPTPAQLRLGEPDRVKAFSDGVFAIVITILVLEIGVPTNLSEASLRESLEETGPELLAWVISFMITGMYWVSHRDLFNQIRRVTRDVVWLNLLLLLPVCLIPFAASILGGYHDDPIALRTYGSVLIAASLMRWVLWAYVARRPSLLHEPFDAHSRRIHGLLTLAPIAAYVLAMALAGIAPLGSLVLYLVIPGLHFILVTVMRQHPETADVVDDLS